MMVVWLWIGCGEPEVLYALGTSAAEVAPGDFILPEPIPDRIDPEPDGEAVVRVAWPPVTVPQSTPTEGVQWERVTRRSKLGHDPETGERSRALNGRRRGGRRTLSPR
ncbi:MAG: hypothetical protein AAGA48_13435 [Myxococcota bacterium]